jgi:hypothetical protein
MKLNVLAMAGALLALTAAAAQASPATVIPDTVHAIGKDAKQVFNGTKKGVTDQYDHDKAAAVRTTNDVRHGTVMKHHHRKYAHRTMHKHVVKKEVHEG